MSPRAVAVTAGICCYTCCQTINSATSFWFNAKHTLFSPYFERDKQLPTQKPHIISKALSKRGCECRLHTVKPVR